MLVNDLVNILLPYIGGKICMTRELYPGDFQLPQDKGTQGERKPYIHWANIKSIHVDCCKVVLEFKWRVRGIGITSHIPVPTLGYIVPNIDLSEEISLGDFEVFQCPVNGRTYFHDISTGRLFYFCLDSDPSFNPNTVTALLPLLVAFK